MADKSNAAFKRIEESFAKQSFMQLIGARLVSVGQGVVEISIERSPNLLQQHGFLHAGVLSAVLDSACGYAALSVMEPDAGVLSVELKTNMLAPAAGSRFLARGSVLKAGRTIVVCRGEAFTADGEPQKLVAAMQATMMSVKGREGVQD